MMSNTDLKTIAQALGVVPERLEAFLKAFNDRGRATEQLGQMASRCEIWKKYPDLFNTWLERLPNCPDPDDTFNQLNRLLDCGLDPLALCARLQIQPEGIDILQGIACQSPFLTEIVLKNPERLAWLLECEDLKQIKRWPHYRQEIEAMLEEEADSLESAAQLLRQYRNRENLRIAVRDILGWGSIDECALELSNLADNMIFEACNQVRQDYHRRFGRPLTEEGAEAQFSVIAMGKLGGRELNFSSDIDLIFVFEGEGRPENKSNWDNFEYFCKLGADLVNLLSASTEEGCLYRVDTRLRPEGSRGALVRSLASMELYYESWGENWERQALLKARPVGGDEALGEKFLRTIRPFTFRKYVDQLSIQETLQTMSAMRSRTIQVHGSTTKSSGENVKTDPGGIRDVEFIVQAIQMLYGGQYPEIRRAGTLESLQRMLESGLLRQYDYSILCDGYLFLRRVEHRLQMQQGLQVYSLPSDQRSREIFAHRLGFQSLNEFLKQLKKYTKRIHEIYQGIFQPFEKKDLLEQIFHEEEGYNLLNSCHLTNIKRARANFESLSQDPDSPHLNPKIRRLFRKILPRLLENIKTAPNSEIALDSFNQIVSAVGARSSFYEVLASNPPFVELLISLGSHSKYLTDILLRFPSMLDRLSDPVFLGESLCKSRLEANHEYILLGMPEADSLDLLRRLKRTLLLKIGLRYLLRLSDISVLTGELTTMAEYIVRHLVDYWIDKYENKYGEPRLESGELCPMAVIGMGKLGGGELGLSSDLDLLFIYQSDEGEVVPLEGGEAKIGIKEYYVRMATEILRSLDAKTQEGTLYEADVRLRPYGKGGDLSSTLEQYKRYCEKDAALWERQALTRARWIAGDRKLGHRFIEQTEAFVYGESLTGEQKDQIAHLRGRIERERKGQAIKSGAGGLVDVEFLAQAHQLELGYLHPQMRSPNTLTVLKALDRCGVLPREEIEKLSDNYLFMRDILNRLQIMDGTSINELPKDPETLEELIRRLYHLSEEPVPEVKVFMKQFDRCRKEIRAVYDRYFSG